MYLIISYLEGIIDMTKAQEFYKKSKSISNQVWDMMVGQAVAFSQGKGLDASYDSVKLDLLIATLKKLQRDIKSTYNNIPTSLQTYYDATLKMADDIKTGVLLLKQ